jgi:hypothetical protein
MRPPEHVEALAVEDQVEVPAAVQVPAGGRRPACACGPALLMIRNHSSGGRNDCSSQGLVWIVGRIRISPPTRGPRERFRASQSLCYLSIYLSIYITPPMRTLTPPECTSVPLVRTVAHSSAERSAGARTRAPPTLQRETQQARAFTPLAETPAQPRGARAESLDAPGLRPRDARTAPAASSARLRDGRLAIIYPSQNTRLLPTLEWHQS